MCMLEIEFWFWLHHENASEKSDTLLEAGLDGSRAQNKRWQSLYQNTVYRDKKRWVIMS